MSNLYIVTRKSSHWYIYFVASSQERFVKESLKNLSNHAARLNVTRHTWGSDKKKRILIQTQQSYEVFYSCLLPEEAAAIYLEWSSSVASIQKMNRKQLLTNFLILRKVELSYSSFFTCYSQTGLLLMQRMALLGFSSHLMLGYDLNSRQRSCNRLGRMRDTLPPEQQPRGCIFLLHFKSLRMTSAEAL